MLLSYERMVEMGTITMSRATHGEGGVRDHIAAEWGRLRRQERASGDSLKEVRTLNGTDPNLGL